ncbi:MAG: CPBP family intramembrane metalloprotease [Brachybacterium sp.]|uniref:CPBP family intramembrane glutamic endopeptidase n=1 Tax=Brachybacterium sp. TaxID=1891286 RepID=UPI0026482496|nr:CPBP family intramembrane glutamic endopeptidase [Brachybacterium sp.]MDN5688314.1 CPBP family intramembrane metalloprotease [Brachybacterium sp.]
MSTRAADSHATASVSGTGREIATDRPAVIVALIGVFVLAIAVTALRHPGGVVVSSDPGFSPAPVVLLLVPAALSVVLTLLLPVGRGGSGVVGRRPGRVRGELVLLLALAAGFTLLVPVLPRPEDYVLAKGVLFLLVPLVLLGESARRRGWALDVQRPEIAPWIVVLPALGLGVLSGVGPFSPGTPTSWPPLPVLLIGASATAITAGLGEELLYRRLLQTRLEAVAGRWTGILLASLLFGLMHTFSHGDGPPWANALQAIAMQGTTGIALGLLWSRWRRIWPCVFAHLLLNGLGVALHLVGVLG